MQPTREEFLHFSTPEKALFYLLVAIALAIMTAQIVGRVRLWQMGRPQPNIREGWQYWIPTVDAARRWLRNIGVYVLAQTKVRSSRKASGAPMHLAIFYGFMALLLATTLLAINTYSPVKFHRGLYYEIYEASFDGMGLVFLIGLLWALGRRIWILTPRFGAHATSSDPHKALVPLRSSWPDFLTLGLLIIIDITGYWLEAARISNHPQPWDRVSWVGFSWASLMPGYSDFAYKSVWWFHAFWVLTFFAVLPRMRIRHILIAIFTTAGKSEVPLGKLRTVSMEEVERTGQVGTSVASDLSRWQLMSLDACMECGRCTEVCPAWNVGKVLNPKEVVQEVRGAMLSGEGLAPRITPEALWQCTTCNACVEACPVLIRHVDIIVDVRRNLVSEGELSGPSATMLRQTASTGHAWGGSVSHREDWMKDLDIPLCRDGVAFDFLFWVGCAGATDPGAISTTKAVARLLQKAGVKFACLGREEACTGDPARRVGEEFLFQDKATQNASVFQRYGVKKVVTACPHCFNSLKHEYEEFGAKLEVYHHTQLLSELVSKGDLLAAKPKRGSTVLHDPCYLGRVNDEMVAPRALAEGLLNPEQHGAKTLCCGAGGGRMWMDELPTQRPATRRTESLLATGATTVAVACPFCRIMLGDSLKQARPNDEIRLVDLAEMLQEANGL